MLSLIAQETIPSVYVHHGNSAGQNRCQIHMISASEQNAAAQKEKKKRKSEKEACCLHVSGYLTVSLLSCCRICHTTAPSSRNVQWLATEEFWRTADVAGRLTVQTLCFGNHCSTVFLLVDFNDKNWQVFNDKAILSLMETVHLPNWPYQACFLHKKWCFKKATPVYNIYLETVLWGVIFP